VGVAVALLIRLCKAGMRGVLLGALAGALVGALVGAPAASADTGAAPAHRINAAPSTAIHAPNHAATRARPVGRVPEPGWSEKR
jgi:hypothetical protein